MTDHARMIAELARAKVVFQQRAIVAVINDEPLTRRRGISDCTGVSEIADTPNATKPAPDGTGCKPADDGV